MSGLPTISPDAVVSASGGGDNAALMPPAQALLQSLTQSATAVGALWIVLSAVFTTWSTTKFLKYPGDGVDAAGQRRRRLRPSASSSASSPGVISNVLGSMPRPALLTFYRFGGSLLLGLLLHSPSPGYWAGTLKRWHSTTWGAPKFALPAFCLFLANYSNSIALSRIGISLTYTSKCGIPLITLLLTLLFLDNKALPPQKALLCLVPIAVGIAAASWNSPSLELVGFAAALVSTMSQAGLNVASKVAMSKTGMSGPEAQRCMVAVGLVLTTLMALVKPVFQLGQSVIASSGNTTTAKNAAGTVTEDDDGADVLPPAWLSIMALTAYHVEYTLGFCFVKLVKPITVGACDAVRRLCIILVGRYFFGGPPFTPVNIAGIALALGGALGYSIFSSSKVGSVKSSSPMVGERSSVPLAKSHA